MLGSIFDRTWKHLGSKFGGFLDLRRAKLAKKSIMWPLVGKMAKKPKILKTQCFSMVLGPSACQLGGQDGQLGAIFGASRWHFWDLGRDLARNCEIQKNDDSRALLKVF